MLISLFLLSLLTFSGLSLTYLFAEDESLLWRLCAGNVIGSVIFGLVCFLAACLFGFTVPTILLAVLASLSPLILFARPPMRANLTATWQKARKNLENIDLKKFRSFAYYFVIFIVLWLFFNRAMFETKDGVFTGSTHNLGDLPFHLGAIFSFADGQNFPPENPSYAFSKFTYPFMTDLVAASFVRLGSAVRGALLVQNIFLGFSLIVLLEKFTFKFTGSRLAGKIAPLLLMFSGGLGFTIFFNDFWHQGKGFFDFVYNLPADYTINDKGIRWGNALTTLFMTQRSLLLGMPLTLIVLQKLWELFAAEKYREEIYKDGQDEKYKKTFSEHQFPIAVFAVGLLAGTLPLIHVHSLAALFVVSAFLFFFRLDKWRDWAMFALGVAFIAVPELLWAMTGSATRLTEFIDWHFGWDKRDDNFFIFWMKNLGLFLPLLFGGLYLIFSMLKKKKSEPQPNADEPKLKAGKSEKQIYHSPFTIYHLLFYVPIAFLFIVPNLLKLAPWEWDNIKVLIYWFVGSVPFVAFFLAWLWKKNLTLKFVAAACLFVLTFSGGLDVWRVMSKQINYNVFSKDSVIIAAQIKQKTAPNALFLNAPTYNSTVVLSGRRSLMRYNGHLASYGIDYAPREEEVKQIYLGTAAADDLLQKNKIEYVVISPEERSNLTVNEDFFKKFPVIAESGQYKVYQVRK